jgi:ABC-2 type transport system permease protein
VFATGAVVLSLTFLDILPPVHGAVGGVKFAIASVFAFFLKFFISFFTGILCFWTTSAVGLIRARTAISLLLSGGLIPIALSPDWLEQLCL